MGNPSHTFLFIIAVTLCGCSPGYVIRAAYEQSKILMHREDIDEALNDPSVSEENKEKLRYVQEARLFAQKLGLEPAASFTKFAPVDRDVLSWVVMGCKKDSFTPHTWWFPIVGSVPYKGFFEKEDAAEAARYLESSGYETWVRGTDAFSTLGWFNDPILTTTLKNPTPSIVNTVIHEITHTTFWFKGSVEFNETLANFIGANGAALFFEDKLNSCNGDLVCEQKYRNFYNEARITQARSIELASTISSLYEALDALYRSNKTSEEKISERVGIFDSAIKPLKEKYPAMKSFSSVNNAEIMQLKIYLTHYDYFEDAYEQLNKDLPEFISSIRSVFSEYTKKAPTDPFKMISNKK